MTGTIEEMRAFVLEELQKSARANYGHPPSILRYELAKRFDRTENQARTIIDKMVKEGLLVKVGNGTAQKIHLAETYNLQQVRREALIKRNRLLADRLREAGVDFDEPLALHSGGRGNISTVRIGIEDLARLAGVDQP